MKFSPLLSLLLLLPGLSFGSESATLNTQPSNACLNNQPQTSNEYLGVKWYRDSAERKAQYYQTFNLGLQQIQTQVARHRLSAGKWGIILDIDETVLDNSLYQKEQILSCHPYSVATNYAFMDRALSTATPGAVDLTCKVQQLGGKVVLVTNRNGNYDNKIQAATVTNLRQQKICFDDVVFASSESDINKTPRFNAVATGDYQDLVATSKLPPLKIIAYFGDNIQDFPQTKQQQAILQQPGDSFYKHLGVDYFSLPNPMYGSWIGNPFK